MNLTSQLTALRNESRNLPLGERAELACRVARKLEKAGHYEGASEALVEFWPNRSIPPNTEGLDLATHADVLLRVGNLVSCLESADQISGSQEMAKDLITKSIEIYEKLGQPEELAQARADLAVCYWREGEFDEARILLNLVLDVIGDVHTELKARVLVFSAIVEKTAGRYVSALGLYKDAKPFVDETNDHALKGTFHNGLGTLLNCQGLSERRADFIDQSLIEYAAASFHFEQAGNIRYLARVENNLGFLYFTIGQCKDAHHHLDRARDLFLQLKDVGTAAQVDETRARTLLAEGRLKDAERTIKAAVRVLEKGGQQAVLAEALTTQGIIAARTGNEARAALLLQRAIVIAETVGDREGSGRAHLTIVEELGRQTGVRQLVEIYQSAVELLEQSQDPATHKRLITCARKVIEALQVANPVGGLAPKIESWEGFSLRREVKKIERNLIERSLRDASGSVTKASQLLGFKHHQSLVSLLNNRHKDLIGHRSAVRKRRRHLFSQPARGSQTTDASLASNQVSILHVEGHKLIGRQFEDLLVSSGFRVQLCSNGFRAWEILKTKAPYDVVIVNHNLPEVSGLELVLRVRSMAHRRNLPIIMLSDDDVEKEAWRAGVDAFLRTSEAANKLTATLLRILEESGEASKRS